MSTPQVLIVGAGPAGLVTALSLAQNGIPFRIIEKATTYHTGSRGFGLQPRTFELFQALGFVEDVQKVATKIPTMRAYKLPGGIEPVKTWDLFERVEKPWPDRPYPNGACLSQTVLEDIMRKHLAKYGVNIELGHELVALEHTSDGVKATILDHLSGSGKRDIIHFDYLVGADGARGHTRKLLGLAFEGETRESDNMVWADFEIRGLSKEFWHFWGNPGELTIVARPLPSLPGNNQFAVAIMGPGLDLAELTRPEKTIDFFVRHTGRNDLQFGEFTWISTFRPNIRIVSKFQDGRCFVVGDAAHVHPPTGGQGLNCGIQDSFNLAWKLALVLKGQAFPDLLSSYNDERLPVIAQMLYATTQLYSHGVTKEMEPLPEPPEPKSDDSKSSGWFRWRNNALFLFGINYRFSTLVVDERDTQPLDNQVARARAYEGYDGAPVRAGDRAPEAPGLVHLDGTETSLFKLFKTNLHTILVFSAADRAQVVNEILHASEGYPGDIVQTILISDGSAKNFEVPTFIDRDGNARDAYSVRENEVDVVVVRPDGIIGGIAVDASGLARYFSKVLNTV